jgi:hypothetical protein
MVLLGKRTSVKLDVCPLGQNERDPFVPNIAVSLGQKGRAYLAPIRRHTPCRQDTPVHV